MTLEATVRAEFILNQTGAGDFGPPRFAAIIAGSLALSDGVDAGEADILFTDERTVASNSNDDLDLAGGLTDAFGNTITLAKIVAIMIINKPKTSGAAANTTNLTLGVGSNPVTGYMGGTNPTLGPIRPGGVRLLAESDVAGLCAVAAGTADILRIANSSGAAATYQIAILGRSA